MALSFKTYSLHPPIGVLDTRSNPADIPAGAFRFKQNFAVSETGKLCRRAGHEKLFSVSANYTNFDHHHQGADRMPLTMLFESVSPAGLRQLYDANSRRISALDYGVGHWVDMELPVDVPVDDPTVRWRAAASQDIIIFTNNQPGGILSHTLGEPTCDPIESLGAGGRNVTRANIVIEWNGVMFLMNVYQDDVEATDPNQSTGHRPSKIIWGDLNKPLEFGISDESIANFQDLSYGEEILAAAPLGKNLMIYTTRSIWRIFLTGSSVGSPFGFEKVYTEPKTQTGCLLYPNTLVSTGDTHYYMGREGIYRYNPYLPQPERVEWMHRASGTMYGSLNRACCQYAVAEYKPEAKELWISWPEVHALGQCYNARTLVLNMQFETADYLDTGYSAFCSFTVPDACGGNQVFIGASTSDLCLKQIGTAYIRESVGNPSLDPRDPLYTFVNWNELPVDDLPADDDADFVPSGYDSYVRGIVPVAVLDREKVLKHITVDDESAEQENQCELFLRVGNSQSISDPNVDNQRGSVVWRTQPTRTLQPTTDLTADKLAAANLRPGSTSGTTWEVYERGTFLYYEFRIANADGSPGVGGQSCWARLDFLAAVV